MRLNHALISLAFITAAYLGVLAWIDGARGVFDRLPTLANTMPVLLALTVVSWLLRYGRWRWLLRLDGYESRGWRSLAAYLAGFAFTATPGKIGELVRIRYFARQEVPAATVISAFVFERMLDLIAVLMLAALGWGWFGGIYTTLVLFVCILVMGVLACAFHPGVLRALQAALEQRGWRRLADGLSIVGDGMAGLRSWLTLPRLTAALLWGLAAWTATAAAFAWLLVELDIILPWQPSLAAYPAAMLAGAASMLPGGLGSTEATIVMLLATEGTGLAVASFAAIGIRLATLWFAILIGVGAVVSLELSDSAARQ